MLRLIFSSILVLHGLLHFIGFVKEWNIGSQGQLSGKALLRLSPVSSRFAGTLWLVTGILILLSTIMYVARIDSYWIPAAAGLLLSQTLIIIYWRDARYGTLVNLILLVAVILAAGTWQFNHMVRREVRNLMRQAGRDLVVTEDMVAPLPPPVQRWLRKGEVIGRKHPNVIRVEQRGSMRTEPDGKWMPFDAVQHFSITPPAFVWHAKVQAGTFVSIGGMDRFSNGHGQMIIRPLHLFTAANSTGPEVSESALQRYIAEIAWFPQAAVSNYIHWEAINENQARATMSYAGTTASCVYTFNEAGDVTGFETMRYGDFGNGYTKERWSVTITGYKTFNHRLIGNASEVTWKLQPGDYKWMLMEVTDID